MAKTKKPVAAPTEKTVPAVSAKPVARPVLVAAKPVASKAVVPAAKAKAATKKTVTVPREVDPAQRTNYIEVAAFYIAERRGFRPGNPEQDYLEAAAEIDRLIAGGHFGK